MLVAITAVSVDPERINFLGVARHEAMERWRGRANAPQEENQTMLAVKGYDATDGGPLFWAASGQALAPRQKSARFAAMSGRCTALVTRH